MKPNIVFTGTKFLSNFNVKDPIPFTKIHEVIYRSVCATENCNEDHVSQCDRRLYDHVNDNNGRNHSSHLVKHTGETGHLTLATDNFEVNGRGYRKIPLRSKIEEALLVEKLKPSLKIQEKSLSIKLFYSTPFFVT